MTYIKTKRLVQALWAKSTKKNICAAVARTSGSTPPQASLSIARTLQSYHPSWLNSWSGSSPENPKSVPKEMGQVHVTNHNMKQALKWPILRYRNNQGLSQGFPYASSSNNPNSSHDQLLSSQAHPLPRSTHQPHIHIGLVLPQQVPANIFHQHLSLTSRLGELPPHLVSSATLDQSLKTQING